MSDNVPPPQSSTNISESSMNPSETNTTASNRKSVSSSPPILRPSKISKIQYFSDDDDEEEDLVEEEINIEVMSKNPRFQRYLVAIEYMGTRFSGCQQQRPSFRTVVGVLKDAFTKFIGQPVSVTCSSRTDTGVHALSNVCHVDVERISKRKPGEVLPPYEPEVVKKAVNHFLQKNEGDIMVIDVRCIPATFHARHKAQERTYFYRLLSGPEPLSIFEKDRAWHVTDELNLFAMQKACRVLVGDHDFSSFRGSRCQAKSPLRTLDELNVTELLPSPSFPSSMDTGQNNCNGKDFQPSSTKSESDLPVGSNSSFDALKTSNGGTTEAFGVRRSHRCIVITARARAFLYHQVRLLVGVLKSVGTGELTIPDVERILNAKSVLVTSPMAPACGLYLAKVKYDM